MLEGAFLDWQSPARRPFVRFVAFITTFSFFLSQTPFITQNAYATPPQHPAGAENLAYITNAANLANIQERSDKFQKEMVQRQTLMSDLENM